MRDERYIDLVFSFCVRFSLDIIGKMPKRRKSPSHFTHKRKHSYSAEEDKHDRRDRRKSSRSQTSESLEKFTDAIKSLLDRSNTVASHSVPFNGENISRFDPEDRNQSVATWCRKIDELKSVYNWTEEATIYFAFSRLRGMAEIWYKGLGSV